MPTRTARHGKKTDPNEPLGLYDEVKWRDGPSLRGEVCGVHRRGTQYAYDVRWMAGRGVTAQYVGTTETLPSAEVLCTKRVRYCNLCEGTGGRHDPNCRNRIGSRLSFDAAYAAIGKARSYEAAKRHIAEWPDETLRELIDWVTEEKFHGPGRRIATAVRGTAQRLLNESY